MPQLRKVSGKECLKILCNKFGFQTVRRRGSHIVLKKETPEEYASRMEYMRGKEQLELEAETQRLFIKAEKQYQNHCPIKHQRKLKCGVQG